MTNIEVPEVLTEEKIKEIIPYLKIIKRYSTHFLEQFEGKSSIPFSENYFKEKMDTLHWSIEQIKLITKQLKQEDCKMISDDILLIQQIMKKKIKYFIIWFNSLLVIV